jgi:hypothetical protein
VTQATPAALQPPERHPRLGLDINENQSREHSTMNTSTTSRGLAAGLLASAVLGVVATGSSAQAVDAPTWEKERGIVLECVGQAHGVRIYTSVYENSRYGNTVQVVVGDPDDGNGNSRQTDEKFLVDGVVKATVKVDGKRVLIEGAAERHGARTKVWDVQEDAGFLIKTRGYHRQVVTDMGARYAGTSVPLACDTAFAYDLEVKKVPVV